MRGRLLLTIAAALALAAVLGLTAVPPPASGATIGPIPATFSDIQTAINTANPGEILVAAGMATLAQTEVITIPSDKLGITLIGAGPGKTILQKSAGTTAQSIIFIGQTLPHVPSRSRCDRD